MDLKTKINDAIKQILQQFGDKYSIEEAQWKEDLLTSINEHEAEIVFEYETDDVKIKGVKFYTANDGRGVIRQIAEIALGRAFKGLGVNS